MGLGRSRPARIPGTGTARDSRSGWESGAGSVGGLGVDGSLYASAAWGVGSGTGWTRYCAETFCPASVKLPSTDVGAVLPAEVLSVLASTLER